MDNSSHISDADALEIADDLFDNEIYGDNPDVVVSPPRFHLFNTRPAVWVVFHWLKK